MRYNIVAFLIIILVPLSYGDQYRDYMNKGQRLYNSEDYQTAAEQFHQAEVLKPDDPIAPFNLGTALYKSQDYNKAVDKFSQSAATAEKKLKSESYYDLGNSQYRNQDYAGALQSYKNALINNPANVDAKHNFELSKIRLEQQQQQQKQQQQKKDENKKDEDQQQQQKHQKDQEQQDQKSQNQQQQEQQQQKPKKGEMTKQEAKELLEAFKEDEKQIQKELKKFKIKSGSARDW
jgi:Ca-activated chloride channel family protein